VDNEKRFSKTALLLYGLLWAVAILVSIVVFKAIQHPI
jgi:hypothetical protein